MNQKGKISFAGIFIVFLVFYGAFAAIKIISANITEDQINKNIKDQIGLERGYKFTEERGREIILEVLTKSNDIVFDPKEEGTIDFTIDDEKKLIIYYYEYELVTDFLFFKKRKKIGFEDDMRSYN